MTDDLKFTAEHEWIKQTDQDGVVRVGITDYAQSALGDIVFVQLPDTGSAVTAGDAVGELESTKSVSDVYAPVAGEISALNAALEATPELVNSDPYGDGWLFEITVTDPDAVAGLLSKADYEATLS